MFILPQNELWCSSFLHGHWKSTKLPGSISPENAEILYAGLFLSSIIPAPNHQFLV